MTSGQGNNPTFSPFSQRAFMRHREPVRTDKRILKAKHQRNGLPVARPSHRHQIARDFNGNRAVYQNLSFHLFPPNTHGLLATIQARIEPARNPQNGEWIAGKGAKFNQLACESGASYQNAPLAARSTYVPILGQHTFAMGIQSARRSQRTASASHSVSYPRTPNRQVAGALLSNAPP